MLNLFFSPIFNDAPEPWQIGFQDSAAPGFDGIIQLHDSIFFYLVLISVGVFWMLFAIIRNFSSAKSSIVYKYLNHGTVIELI
jgi:cytochrome c oxidase subunit 2